MKTLLLLLIMVVTSESAALKSVGSAPQPAMEQQDKIRITVGKKHFPATLEHNRAAEAFKLLLTLTITMSDYNANEKKYDFPNAFPAQDAKPGQIKAGDLMLWNGQTLVLFYKPSKPRIRIPVWVLSAIRQDCRPRLEKATWL